MGPLEARARQFGNLFRNLGRGEYARVEEIPTVQKPITNLMLHFDSVSPVDLSKRFAVEWQNLLKEPPKESFGNQVFLFKESNSTQAMSIVNHKFVSFRTNDDPTRLLPALAETVLNDIRVEPEGYKTEIVGVFPSASESTYGEVGVALAKPRQDAVAAIEASTGLKVMGVGHDLYVKSRDSFYIVSYNPDIRGSGGLVAKVAASRSAPVTIDRVERTLQEDWSFFAKLPKAAEGVFPGLKLAS